MHWCSLSLPHYCAHFEHESRQEGGSSVGQKLGRHPMATDDLFYQGFAMVSAVWSAVAKTSGHLVR